MANTLASAKVAGLLAELFAKSDENDPAALARIKAEADAKHGGQRYAPALLPLFDQVYMPVPPDVGQVLYLLTRAKRPDTIVEVGTSFGVSAIHFAAAIRDNGHGRLIASELSSKKVEAARANLAAAELADLVEIRAGDASETLKSLEPKIDLLLLDGWKDGYLAMLKFLEPKLAAGALVIGDDTKLFPDRLAPYLAYVRDPKNGYLSIDLPLGDGVEISLRA